MTGRGRGRGGGDRGRGGGERGAFRGGGDRGGSFRGGGERGGAFRGGGDRGGSFRGGGDRGRGRGGGGPPEVYRPRDGNAPLPSLEVAKVEDAYLKNLTSLSQGLTGLSLGNKGRMNPPRPGYGTRGTKVILYANYFEMVHNPALVLYRYNIEVSPTVAGKKLSQIVRLLLQDSFTELQKDLVTDFKSTLLSRTKLDITSDFSITYRAEGEDEPRPGAKAYKVHVQQTGTLNVSELTDYLNSTNADAVFGNKLELIQALNILMGHYAKASPMIATVGSGKAFPLGQDAETTDLRSGLIAIKGFFSSVRVAASRILLNVNVSNGAFYNPVRLDKLMLSYGPANLYRLDHFLKKLRVKALHMPEKKNKAGVVIPRVKAIFGLATKDDGHGDDHPPKVARYGAGANDVQFFLSESSPAPSNVPGALTEGSGKKSGKKKGKGEPSKSDSGGAGQYITVYDYFKTTYNITLENPRISVVNVGTREKPSYLPAQVCEVMPGQTANSKLDSGQTDQMIRFAVLKPYINAQNIVDNSPRVIGSSGNINPILARFGVRVNPNLITVPGRVLAAPEIKYKANSRTLVPRFGSWNLIDTHFNTTTRLPTWSYLAIIENQNQSLPHPDYYSESVTKLFDALRKVGIAAERQKMGKVVDISRHGPEDPELEKRFAEFVEAGIPFLLVILPSKNITLYNRIKLLGDVRYGLHTVCVVADKFWKGDPQYLGNVSLKFNLKLGGINHVVDNIQKLSIDMDKTMLVGLDVTHPSPGSATGAPSVAAIVASIDKFLGQYPADLRIQASREEMVTDLREMMKTRLQLWKTRGKHQSFPENILIYRDGVSEGQYDRVLVEELPLIRKACEETYLATATKEELPKISIVIVGKRHHTRFYPTKADNADRSSNPACGTIVDRGVTEARNWDFFLQAHTAIQGTARSAHYYVILDEIFHKRKLPAVLGIQNTADVLEELTHSMCYSFGRATKAVSLCPPAYYADIVCTRARCYLSGLFDISQQNTPAASVRSGGQGQVARAEDVRIHDRLKNSMFYT